MIIKKNHIQNIDMMRECYPKNIKLVYPFNQQTCNRNIVLYNTTYDLDLNTVVKDITYFWDIVKILYLFGYDFSFNFFDEADEFNEGNKGYFSFGKYSDIIYYDYHTNKWTICDGEDDNDDLFSNKSLFYLLLDYSGKKKILKNFFKTIITKNV